MKLPLWLKHKIRDLSFWLDYKSQEWVIPNSSRIIDLIENTSEPNFDEYFKRLAELEKAWGRYDFIFEHYKVAARGKKFRLEYRKNNPEKI